MNSSRIWTLGAVVAVLAILGGAFGLGVQPRIAAAAAADASIAQVQQATATTQVELTRLAKLSAKQADLELDERRLGSAVTTTLKLNTFSRQLREVAAVDGVKITSLSTAQALDYVPPVSTAVAAPAPSSSSTPTPTPSATATAAAAAVADPGQFGTTDPLITGTNFVVIPVTVIVSGSEASGIAFAQHVQQMQRLFAVNNVIYSKGSDTALAPTTTISGNIYSLKR